MNARILSPRWQRAVQLLCALLIWILYWYWDSVVAMVSIWARSDTYAHAFVVPLITFWLIWNKRSVVLVEQPRPSMLLATPIALSSVAWLFGELTAVNALTQFALVATLVMAIMAALGIQVSKHIAFPLAFLFFSVPIGDFMLPQLMEWTATFTVLALRATGVPVYQEGLQFVIPSGHWSVVEACSGIRYIIASVTVGTLFAYLNYVSLRRRVMFIVVSMIVPIFANWLRAYLIVMLGHLSGNKLAAGVDHLIYGWVFFGIVIMIMFMIGMRWSEPSGTVSTATLPRHLPVLPATAWLAAPTIALLAALGPVTNVVISRADRPASPVITAVIAPPKWSEAPLFVSWHPAYDNPSTEIHKAFVENGVSVGLYIGYYRNQDYQHKLVTSTNTLAHSNDKVWSVIQQKTLALDINSLPTRLRSATLLGKDTQPETRLRVWQWYWVNGHLTDSDIQAILLTAISRLQGKGDDSAVVMLYASEQQANDALPKFAADAGPFLNTLLLNTRNNR